MKTETTKISITRSLRQQLRQSSMPVLCLWVFSGCLPAKKSTSVLNSVALKPLSASPESQVKGEDLAKLYEKLDGISPLSSTVAFVKEPPLLNEVPVPHNLDAVGYGKSQFLVDTRWATVRYLGPTPAGAGLEGKDLNDAQIAALGKRNDSIPVVTSVVTINRMMEEYFVPLLKGISHEQALISRIKVQGAYYSPDYAESASLGVSQKRDNAFIVGLQSLYVFPSSCFDSAQQADCTQSFSAGHDPTVIGHELGHVIFNHMREEKSLVGYQWLSVNEGFADYFSASYFSEPVIGKSWMASKKTGPKYLRRLLDNPNVRDSKNYESEYNLSQVWSSSLWRIRERLIKENQLDKMLIDKIYLESILHLGESGKTALGDASEAVLKSADLLGYSKLKPTIKEEFEKVNISPNSQKASDSRFKYSRKDLDDNTANGSGCGVVGSTQNSASQSLFLSLFFIFSPLLILIFRAIQRKERL